MSTIEHLETPISRRPRLNAATDLPGHKDEAIALRRRPAGSSFLSAMRLLPARRREAMRALYAFCREVDDIADGDASRSLKQALLSNWRSEIAHLYAGRPRHTVTRSLNDIRPDARRAAPRHNGALPYQHGRIDCELIAAGETKMQRSAYGLIVLLTLTAIPLSAEAAPAQADRQANCVASVDAIRAEWRKLSHSSSLKPSQRIATGDGHWLAGSQVNYAYILIGRADNACGASKVKQAQSYVDEANILLNPAPSGIMLAARPGN